ncbi:hypothetical protein [Cupriavidus numazuensis]|uniref:Uncharacterized protein n=1 Tax=Cupriavidus numazuensis TaxID=221992 RepID=A0ABM8TAX7_9BURK|nr:hypothetical protein [Cupriavidus numazuensis]CAG2132486.1 hypothetical protein LMG26411_00626 [Cupriavidus numazuensis]
MPLVSIEPRFGVRTPRVYRFLQKQYVDKFFETGELLLGSFLHFASHPDETRFDGAEGAVTLVHRTDRGGGQTVLMDAGFGESAYALCGSVNPSVSTRNKFGADSGIVITDPVAFAREVANVLPGFRRTVQGPCSYQGYRAIESDLGHIDFGCNEETSDPSKLDQGAVQQAFSTMLTEDAYFIKHSDFHAECEYRVVWEVDHVADRPRIVNAPGARKYCRRWEDLEWIGFGA